MDDAIYEKLSGEEKKWVAHAVAGMVLADGTVDSSELVYLGKAISFLGEQKTIDELIEMVKERKLPPLRALVTKGASAYQMLKLLASVAGADGKFSRSEADFLKLAGKQIGLDSSFVADVLKLAKLSAEYNKEDARLENISSRIV